MSAVTQAIDSGVPSGWTSRSRQPVATLHRASISYRSHRIDYVDRFYSLVRRWRTETALSSRVSDKIQSVAFQKIVALGDAAVPLILKELRQTPDFLFMALQFITKENPAAPETAGRVSEIIDAWMQWAERTGADAG